MLVSLLMALQLSGTPDVSRLNDLPREPTITYLDRSGAYLGARGGKYGPPVDVDRLPAYVPAAFVAIEDRRFYEHAGFDPVGIGRAIISDLRHGGTREGASTITQQLARNLFLTPDQTLERKAQELLLAIEIERRYSKKQILGLYLNRIYFGAGAYGLEAASRRYFNKPATQLTLAEAATLAGIPKSPTAYNPAEHPQAAAQRAGLVLDAMVETGAITPAQRAAAERRPVRVYSAPASLAQYFLDWTDKQVREMIGGAPKQDLTVETTLDSGLEAAAARSIAAVWPRAARMGVEQTALVSLDGEGRVRAFVGGVDYARSQFDRVLTHRQAGSAWKPFVYLTALEAGRTPETVVVDEPVTIGGWSPRNFEPEFLGPIPLRTALAQSVNTVAARLADEVGRPNVAATARRLGITSPISLEPAMALGSSEVSPLEMAQAYDSFANGGQRVQAYAIERIRANGRVIYERRPQPPVQAIAPLQVAEMDDMLRGVIATGTGKAAKIAGYDLAGKTGTTSDYRDAWFCGFTGGFTTVVWMGRDDSTPMRRVTGGSAPVELWRTYMVQALKRVQPRPLPAPVRVLPVPDSVPIMPAPAPQPAGPPAPPRDAVDDLLPGSALPPLPRPSPQPQSQPPADPDPRR